MNKRIINISISKKMALTALMLFAAQPALQTAHLLLSKYHQISIVDILTSRPAATVPTSMHSESHSQHKHSLHHCPVCATNCLQDKKAAPSIQNNSLIRFADTQQKVIPTYYFFCALPENTIQQSRAPPTVLSF